MWIAGMIASMLFPPLNVRERMIDEAVRRADVPAWWSEFLSAFEIEHGPDGRSGLAQTAPEACHTCRGAFGSVRARFRDLCGCDVCKPTERRVPRWDDPIACSDALFDYLYPDPAT